VTVSKAVLAGIQEAYQVWSESGGEDMRPLLDLMSDDIEAVTLPDGTDPLAFTKPCQGKVEMTAYCQGLQGDWELVRADVEDVVAERDLVVVLLKTAWRNRRTEKDFEGPAAHAWRFRDGFAIELRLFFDSMRWVRAAGLD